MSSSFRVAPLLMTDANSAELSTVKSKVPVRGDKILATSYEKM